MKYCKEDSKINNTEVIVYTEVKDDTTPVRQIAIGNNFLLSSNIKDEEKHFWLCDQEIDIVNDGYVMIQESEFNKVWADYMKPFLSKWEEIKQIYTIGLNVIGTIEVFYPQGVLIELADGIIALADYEECKSCNLEEGMYPGTKVKGHIVGYDDLNMWIKMAVK